MKIKFFILILTCLLTLLICGACGAEEIDMPNEFTLELTDDSKLLTDILTRTYKLQDLENFFGDISANESLTYEMTGKKSGLSIREVNKKFPIECFRKAGYSVYAVSGGGYFYVFYERTFNPFRNFKQTYDDANVYFTAYIAALKSASDFDDIQVGISTAEDVFQIDPAAELSFIMSSRIYSYSLLEDGTVMEIEYSGADSIKCREDLQVKSKHILYRENASSSLCLMSILPSDLP